MYLSLNCFNIFNSKFFQSVASNYSIVRSLGHLSSNAGSLPLSLDSQGNVWCGEGACYVIDKAMLDELNEEWTIDDMVKVNMMHILDIFPIATNQIPFFMRNEHIV